MRILYITQTFPPEPGPTKRPLRNAIELQELGHYVDILTTMPYYPHGIIYKQYKGHFRMKEQIDGIRVFRIWSIPANNTSKLRRIMSYLSFMVLAALKGLLLPRYDLVIGSVPNIGTELSAIIIGRFRRSKVILESRDVIPENLVFIGASQQSLFCRILKTYYNTVCKLVDWVAVPAIGMVHALISRGVKEERILYLPHAADFEILEQPAKQDIRDKYGLRQNFVATYAGAIGRYHGIDNIIQAAEQMEAIDPTIKFLIIGTGPNWDSLNELLKKIGIKNVILTGPVSPADLPDYLRIADIFISSYNVGNLPPIYNGYLTSKFLDYMMYSRPVISIEKQPYVGELLEKIDAGVWVESDKPDILYKTVLRYKNHPALVERQGLNGYKYVRQYHDRKTVIADFNCSLRKRMRIQDDISNEQVIL
jgi:colanic acid biosynthesis glycosyl transferase WcaI